MMSGISDGAMSAVHTVTVISVSVAVRTSLMALIYVFYPAAKYSADTQTQSFTSQLYTVS